MSLVGRRTLHHGQSDLEIEAKRFTQRSSFSRERVESDAHVVVDDLDANAHARPTGIYKFIAHQHQDRPGAFDLSLGATRKQQQ